MICVFGRIINHPVYSVLFNNGLEKRRLTLGVEKIGIKVKEGDEKYDR